MPKKEFVSVKIDKELKKNISDLAQKEHRSFSGQVLSLVELGLSVLEKEVSNEK
jgi:hypothetical protein